MERNDILHYLRNPYGHDEHTLREARLLAADELERLYKIEEKIKSVSDKISTILNIDSIKKCKVE